MAMTDEQIERYSRHIILKEVGAKGQKKLLNAKVLIIGAGGHARVVADIAMKSGRSDIALLDDAVSGEVMGFPVIGKLADAAMLADPDTEFIAAVGSCQMRRSITEALHLPWATLIHPSAQIGADVSIG